MRILNLLIGILIAITIMACSSDDSSNGSQQSKNVKRITKLATAGSSEATHDFTYNENNQIITSDYFEGGLNYVAERFYDNQDKLIGSNSVNHFNQVFQRDYFYDDSLKLIGAQAEREGSIYDDYTVTYEPNNVVNISGTINSALGAAYDLVLNNSGYVIGNTANNRVFLYDSNQNLTNVKYYNFNNELNKELVIDYDNNKNPFYQEYNSNYLDIFLDNFYPDANSSLYYANEIGMLSLFRNNIISITTFENNTQTEKQIFNFSSGFTQLEVVFTSSNYSETKNYIIEYFE